MQPSLVLASVGVLISGLAQPPASAAPIRPAPVVHASKHPMVLGLGDSALTNQGCSCPDLLVDYAELAGARIGKDIQARNEAKSGSTSKDLVGDLGDGRIRSEIDAADVVVLFTGANDFVDAFDKVARGGSPKKQYGPVADEVRNNVETAVSRVRRRNAHARIVVCGYWNDFKAGSVARHEYSAAQRKAADKATDYTNRALHAAADRTGVHYVSTRELFRQEDITPYLAADGDHLSAAGHRKIARALVDLLHPGQSVAASSAASTTPAPDPQPAPRPDPQPAGPLLQVPLRPSTPPRI